MIDLLECCVLCIISTRWLTRLSMAKGQKPSGVSQYIHDGKGNTSLCQHCLMHNCSMRTFPYTFHMWSASNIPELTRERSYIIPYMERDFTPEIQCWQITIAVRFIDVETHLQPKPLNVCIKLQMLLRLIHEILMLFLNYISIFWAQTMSPKS